MTSFIDLMASDVWSDADITRRTEAMIRTEFSDEAETILNRKALGMSLGTYSPSSEELTEMARYTAVAQAAHDAGVAARADMALLNRVLAIEAARRRLAAPPVAEDAGAEQIAADVAARAAAQALIDGSTTQERDLLAARSVYILF